MFQKYCRNEATRGFRSSGSSLSWSAGIMADRPKADAAACGYPEAYRFCPLPPVLTLQASRPLRTGLAQWDGRPKLELGAWQRTSTWGLATPAPPLSLRKSRG